MEISSANKYVFTHSITDKQLHLNAILNFKTIPFKAGPAPILITKPILLAFQQIEFSILKISVWVINFSS
jgi:hypothetical protein